MELSFLIEKNFGFTLYILQKYKINIVDFCETRLVNNLHSFLRIMNFLLLIVIDKEKSLFSLIRNIDLHLFMIITLNFYVLGAITNFLWVRFGIDKRAYFALYIVLLTIVTMLTLNLIYIARDSAFLFFTRIYNHMWRYKKEKAFSRHVKFNSLMQKEKN